VRAFETFCERAELRNGFLFAKKLDDFLNGGRYC
jgi:hypothetical protein